MTTFFPTLNTLQQTLNQNPTGDDTPITGWSIDTRTLEAGNVFIALTGTLPAPFTTEETPNNDGHNFLAAAQKAGASAAIVSTPNPDIALLQIVVPDTFNALWQLAEYVRKNTPAKVIAITGSAGKTTCKDMLTTLLQAHGPVGSYNNAWGVPLTLLRLPPERKNCVLELGMNQKGEMAELSNLAKPDVAIVLNTLPVHTAGVGGLDGVIQEKLAIAAGIKKDGTLILNNTIDTTKHLHWRGNTIRFGDNTPHHLTATGKAIINSQEIPFTLPNPTPPRQINALVALLAAQTIGANLAKMTPRLTQAQTPNGRGNQINIGNITLIDDSYNANPASVKAALSTLQHIPTKGKRYALLGDMKELGPDEIQYHKDLAQYCADIDGQKIDGIFTCGPLMAHLAPLLTQHLAHFETPQHINIQQLTQHIAPHDVLLVKGSKSVFFIHQTVQKIAAALPQTHA